MIIDRFMVKHVALLLRGWVPGIFVVMCLTAIASAQYPFLPGEPRYYAFVTSDFLRHRTLVE